jgi:hypothetical protein
LQGARGMLAKGRGGRPRRRLLCRDCQPPPRSSPGASLQQWQAGARPRAPQLAAECRKYERVERTCGTRRAAARRAPVDILLCCVFRCRAPTLRISRVRVQASAVQRVTHNTASTRAKLGIVHCTQLPPRLLASTIANCVTPAGASILGRHPTGSFRTWNS